MQLRGYQTDVILKTREALKSGFKRPLIVLPCGSGKTVCFAYMANEAMKKNKIVWFLVHRKELLDQTVETFNRFGIKHDNIIIGMVGTVKNNMQKLSKPDMIIFDEAHFSVAATWQKIISEFLQAFIIGLTATPERLDGKPLGDIYDCLITGISTKELITMKYLSDYKYYTVSMCDLKKLKTKCGEYDQSQAADLLSTSAIFGDVIKTYKQFAENKKAICYCPTIKYSNLIAENFRNAGISTVHFDGNTPTNERKKIIEDFRLGKIQVLCNVDLISVGFDVPDCECCILLRPTKSTALFIQQSMRCLRPLENKTAIILDHVGNALSHGLPDDERNWDLKNAIPKKEKEESTISVRQCLKCYYTYRSEQTKCPSCGHINPKTEREIEIIEKMELQELKRVEQLTKKEAYRNVHTCKTRADLEAYAEKYGYKKGWVWQQMKIRKIYE